MAARKKPVTALSMSMFGLADPTPAPAPAKAPAVPQDGKVDDKPKTPNLPPVGSAPRGPCAYCGDESEGRYGVKGAPEIKAPLVALCDRCGRKARPTLEEIWAKVAERATKEA